MRPTVPANAIDVSSRVSFIAPTGPQGSNCFRTAIAGNRACAIGDQPQFLAQVYNEGTTPIADPARLPRVPGGHQLRLDRAVGLARQPPGRRLRDPRRLRRRTRRLPFAFNGTLPAGGAAMYTVTLLVTPDAPLTTTFQTKG